MLDITSESTLSLNQATKLLPAGRLGRPVSLGCVLRWILDGTKTSSGERVRLEALRLGGRWVTSREALQRFAEALTPSFDTPTAIPSTSRTPGRRQRASDHAAAELEKIGI